MVRFLVEYNNVGDDADERMRMKLLMILFFYYYLLLYFFFSPSIFLKCALHLSVCGWIIIGHPSFFGFFGNFELIRLMIFNFYSISNLFLFALLTLKLLFLYSFVSEKDND